MRVLIAGCGYVGARLAAELVAGGHRVWGLTRHATELPAGVQNVVADLSVGSLALTTELDAVVFAVAAKAHDEATYRAIYVRGAENLLASLTQAGLAPKRLIFTSSTAVYAQDDGSWVDEGSPTQPVDFTGRIMLEAERVFATAPYPHVVVRLGGIYGPGRMRLVEEVRSRRAQLQPGVGAWTNRIHRDDCAGVLAHLLMLDQPDSCYIGVDCEPALRNVVLSWLASELGVAPLSAAAAASSRRPSNKRCSNARLLASGYRFRYPSFREGYLEGVRTRHLT